MGHWSLLMHGLLLLQQDSLSQQANEPPTAPVHAHCPVLSFGHWLLNGSQAQAPWTHSPLGLQHSRFVPALQIAPPCRLQRRRCFLVRAAAPSGSTATRAAPASSRSAPGAKAFPRP